MADKVIGFRIVVKGSEETITKLSEVELELSKIAEELKKAKAAGDGATYAKLRQEQEALRNGSKLLREELAAQKKSFEGIQSAEGSYRALDARLIALRKRFKEISQAEREGAIGKQLLKDINVLDTQLKKIDDTIGQNQRKVGGYARDLKGLFGQLRGALSSTLLVGQIRNLPQLLGTLQQAFTFVTDSIDQYRDATDEAYALSKKTNKAIDENTAEFAKNKIQLDTVFGTLKNTTKGTDEYDTALQAVNKTYGPYLDNLLTNDSSLQDIKDAQAKATAALIDDTVAKIQSAAATEIINNLFKEQLQLQRAQASIDKGGFVNFVNDLTGANAKGLELIGQNIEKTKAEFGLLKGATKGVKDAITSLAETDVSLFGILGAGSTEGEKEVVDAAKKAAEKAAEEVKKEIEKAQKQLLDSQKKFEQQREDIQKASFTELERQRIEQLDTEREREIENERKRLADFQAAQAERLKKVDESNKAEIAKLEEGFGKGSEVVMEELSKLAQDRIVLEQDVQKIVQQEIAISNEKILEIDKAFAEKQAKARLDIQKQALQDSLQTQEAGTGSTEANIQTIQLKFEFDQAQSDFAFEQAKAALQLQLTQGEITEGEFAQKTADLQIQQLEATKQIAAERLVVEQALQAQLLAQQQQANATRLQIELQEIEAEKQARLQSLQETFNQGLITQEEFEQSRLQVIQSGEQRAGDARAATLQENAALEQAYSQQVISASQERAQSEIEIEQNKADAVQEIRDAQVQKVQETAQLIASTFNQVADLINQIGDAATKKQIDNTNKRYDDEAKLAFGNAEKLSAIEKKRDKEIEQIQKRQAARQKTIAIAQAVINGALAVTNILATVPKVDFGVSTAILIGLAIATTAAQVAVIAGQKLERGGVLFEDGGNLGEGVVVGPSHAEGGVKVMTPTGAAEIEGGEWVGDTEDGSKVVVNKANTRQFRSVLERTKGSVFNGKRAMLSRINTFAGRGRAFAQGGALSVTPLSAPAVSGVNKEVQAITELKQQNALLLQNNALLLGNIEAINNRIDNLKVINDPEESSRIGAEQIKRTNQGRL